jgi:photosystem II stability/assembly factor-like uncharacterized protein
LKLQAIVFSENYMTAQPRFSIVRYFLSAAILCVGFASHVTAESEGPSHAVGVPAADSPQTGEPGKGPHGAMAQSSASIQAMASEGKDTVYAGSFGMGVFRSHDRGKAWVPANEGLTDPFILCLAVGPDGALYAGTFRGGVFRSHDQGKSWQPINRGLKRLEIKTVLIAQDAIYAGTGNGVYRLSPHEDQWSVVTGGLEDILVHALVQLPDGTLVAGTSGKGIQRFKNQGSGWARMRHGLRDHEGLVENFIRVLARDNEQDVYAGTFDGGVFRSGDGGQTWHPISRALPNDSIRGIVSTSHGLYVATGRGVFKTTDKGRQWIPLNKGLQNLAVQTLIESASGSLYAGTSSGAFRSDDDGLTWIPISEGLEGTAVPPFRF